MSTNEQINAEFERLREQRKQQGKSVTEHNDQTFSAASRGQQSRSDINSLRLAGDADRELLQLIKQRCKQVSLHDLFHPESPVKAPFVGGGYSQISTAPSSSSSSSSFRGGGGRGAQTASAATNGRPFLHDVFKGWPEVKNMLWEFVTKRYNVNLLPFVSPMFVAEFERTLTTVIDRSRAFYWEELELVMHQFLLQLFGQIEEKLDQHPQLRRVLAGEDFQEEEQQQQFVEEEGEQQQEEEEPAAA